MGFDLESSRAASPDLVNRRLASGLLLSILFHALLLSLRFGVPGLGLPLPFTPPPISIVLAPPEPAAPAAVEPGAAKAPPLPAPKTGMQMVDPLPPPAPAAPVLAKARPSRPRRISRPLPPREPVESPTRVIAQDQNPNESFVVPLPQPEESVQKTTDPKEAQEGSDDGTAAQAALLAEENQKQALAEKLAAEAKIEREEQARLLAETRAAQESRKLEEEQKIQEQQRRSAQELAERTQMEEQAASRQKQADDDRAARQQAELAVAREQAEQLARTQAAQEQRRRQEQADQLAARQKADELVLRQQAEELALRQKTEELAARQRAEDLARQKAAETERQQAEQLARQQAEQLARQQAEQLARQQAEQAARQQAEQAARQQAEQAARQQAEAAQRERERAASAIASAGSGNNAGASGGTGATVPQNLLGSDAGNRVRELATGIELLSGDPPQPPRPGDAQGNRRIVVGPSERDVPLRMYVDSFRQKIERNGGLAVSPMSGDRVRIDPLVSVALRSDGSVEDVTIVRSSGHAEIDNAVRRIVRINARFSAFPPNIAEKYDVIEIRRIWSFAETLKLMEELR